jgi:hypothetical protein
MSEVLLSPKVTSSWILSRAALVGMLVQPETVPTAHQLTVPTEGSDEFVCPTGSLWPRAPVSPKIV